MLLGELRVWVLVWLPRQGVLCASGAAGVPGGCWRRRWLRASGRFCCAVGAGAAVEILAVERVFAGGGVGGCVCLWLSSLAAVLSTPPQFSPVLCEHDCGGKTEGLESTDGARELAHTALSSTLRHSYDFRPTRYINLMYPDCKSRYRSSPLPNAAILCPL